MNGKPTARLRAHNHAEGLTRRLRRGRWGCRPEGGSTFFRSERKYQRKHAARRLRRRPTSLCTAAKPCAALGLGYALHGFQPFLALVGLRPAVAPSGLSSSTGCPVSHSSLTVALLASRPPCGSLWATPKAPLGPRFPSGQFTSLTRRKKASIAHFAGGARYVARTLIGEISLAIVRAPNSPFSAVKIGGPFSLRCLSPLCSAATLVRTGLQ